MAQELKSLLRQVRESQQSVTIRTRSGWQRSGRVDSVGLDTVRLEVREGGPYYPVTIALDALEAVRNPVNKQD